MGVPAASGPHRKVRPPLVHEAPNLKLRSWQEVNVTYIRRSSASKWMVCPIIVKTVAPLSSLTILRNFSSAMLIRLRRLIRSLSLTAM